MAKIVLVGKSSAGKTTVANILTEDFRYEKSVSVTTRPMREGEVNGVDYIFVTPEDFKKMEEEGDFIETAVYGTSGWTYGTLKTEVVDGKDVVYILNPKGLELFKQNKIDFISFYVAVDDRSRLIRQMQRGDDIDEIIRRHLADKEDFKGIEDKVDFVVNNDTEAIECVDEILYDIVRKNHNDVTIEDYNSLLGYHEK